MKTLAMIKMEKNFLALEKGYPREPYEKQTTGHLMGRLEQEVKELRQAVEASNVEGAKEECGDIANILDYLFERLSNGKVR